MKEKALRACGGLFLLWIRQLARTQLHVCPSQSDYARLASPPTADKNSPYYGNLTLTNAMHVHSAGYHYAGIAVGGDANSTLDGVTVTTLLRAVGVLANRQISTATTTPQGAPANPLSSGSSPRRLQASYAPFQQLHQAHSEQSVRCRASS